MEDDCRLKIPKNIAIVLTIIYLLRIEIKFLFLILCFFDQYCEDSSIGDKNYTEKIKEQFIKAEETVKDF